MGSEEEYSFESKNHEAFGLIRATYHVWNPTKLGVGYVGSGISLTDVRRNRPLRLQCLKLESARAAHRDRFSIYRQSKS